MRDNKKNIPTKTVTYVCKDSIIKHTASDVRSETTRIIHTSTETVKR